MLFVKEKSTIAALALIMTVRLLGLFMILPIFAAYMHQIADATPFLIGVALGIYGFTQALLQIPFGTWSDRVGRKSIIGLGILIFIAGSTIAALSNNIYGIILGRALQGAGAVGSTILATVADLTRDESRSQAMAFMGLSIGIAFALAMLLGPIINAWFHLHGVFWTSAGLGVLGFLLLIIAVPEPPQVQRHQDIEAVPQRFHTILRNPQLLRLNFGIFTLHAILTAMFIEIPILFSERLHLSGHQQTLVYLVVLLVAFILALPFIIIAERKRKIKAVFLISIGAILLSLIGLCLSPHHVLVITLWLMIFFIAFTLLEALLPSLISKQSPIRNKGTAMGLYSSSQFFGIFFGGFLGGLIYSHFLAPGIYLFGFVLGTLWFLLALSMKPPSYLSIFIFKIADQDFAELHLRLHTLPGIAEVMLSAQEGLMYIKADRQLIDEDELRKRIEAGKLAADH